MSLLLIFSLLRIDAKITIFYKKPVTINLLKITDDNYLTMNLAWFILMRSIFHMVFLIVLFGIKIKLYVTVYSLIHSKFST